MKKYANRKIRQISVYSDIPNQGKQGSENTGAGGSAWYADKEGCSRDGNAGGSGVVVIKFSIK